MKSLSTPTRTYLIATYLSGALILLPGLIDLQIAEPVMFAFLCILGSILHILKVEGATNRSHYTFSFLVFGFAILHFGPTQALLIVLISNLAEWVWNRPQWFIQLFNIGCYLVASQVAIWIYTILNPLGTTTSWLAIVAIVLSMASFTLVNHLIIGVVVWLARGENFKQSGIFGIVPLLIDLIVLTLGASMALIWDYNPYALFIFLAPAYPLYMALRIPALERKTEIDQKTGLYNHAFFMTQFNNELQRANRYDRPLSVIIADLDLLRNINNTYGHLAGDEVLKGVAEILRHTVRDYDIVARFGGEEFAILMPETEIEKATQRAEYIRKAIESARFVVPTSVDPIKVTMSFGVSKRETFEQSREEILHHADTALYQSKLSGRNRSLAYVNNSFMTADPNDALNHQPVEDALLVSESSEQATSTPQYTAASSQYVKRLAEPERPPEAAHRRAEEQPALAAQPQSTRRASMGVHRYIAGLAIAAIMTAGLFVYLSLPTTSAFSSSDWVGFAAIASLIVVAEWFSISLYVRNTSLSTAAVPIIALVILFGPVGTLVASALFAITAAIKFRSQFNRLVFNFSNHVFAGTIINIFIYLAGPDVSNWKYPHLELIVVLVTSLILFVCTTIMVSIGIGLDHRQSPLAVWKEQYKWMAPYYLGIGFISFSLMFGYAYAGLLGIVTMVIPLVLLRISQAQYVEHTRAIVNEIRQKNQELEKASHEINEMNEGLLSTLSEIIDLRDPYVLGHSKQVSKYATDIARLVGLNDKQIDLIRKAGLLHDIGKLGISMEILTKPARLTAEEFEIIKSHAALGGELVKNSPSLRSLVPIIRHHHEFYNGMGYPDELAGNQISIEARIVAVADAIEAMTSDRPYRKALKPEQVIEELKRYSGTQFDPLVAKEAIRLLEGSQAEKDPEPEQSEQPGMALTLKVNLQTY